MLSQKSLVSGSLWEGSLQRPRIITPTLGRCLHHSFLKMQIPRLTLGPVKCNSQEKGVVGSKRGKKSEFQRGRVACPRSHSKSQEAEQKFRAGERLASTSPWYYLTLHPFL